MMYDYKIIILFAILVIFSLFAIFLISTPIKKHKLSSVIVISLSLLLVIILYVMCGGIKHIGKYYQDQANKKRIQQMLANINSPDELIDRLKATIDKNPSNAKGWYLLGRVYISQNKYNAAHKAFTRAYKLNHDDNLIVINYAESLLRLGNNEGRRILENLLEKDPKQQDSLAILAAYAYNNKEYKKAIDYWQRLLEGIPSQSEEASYIRKAIAKAYVELKNN